MSNRIASYFSEPEIDWQTVSTWQICSATCFATTTWACPHFLLSCCDCPWFGYFLASRGEVTGSPRSPSFVAPHSVLALSRVLRQPQSPSSANVACRVQARPGRSFCLHAHCTSYEQMRAVVQLTYTSRVQLSLTSRPPPSVSKPTAPHSHLSSRLLCTLYARVSSEPSTGILPGSVGEVSHFLGIPPFNWCFHRGLLCSTDLGIGMHKDS